MTFRLFDSPEREPSQFVGFAGNPIERLSEKRSDDGAAQALGDAEARVMLMREGRLWLRVDGEFAGAWLRPAHAQAFGA